MRIVPIIIVLLSIVAGVSAQTVCIGSNALSEPRCAGDELSPEERELIRLINDYRAQNQLAAIPASDALTHVANRHLIDIAENLGVLTHSWSDCAYDVKDESTWPCIFKSPVRLKTNYKGDGFENLYRSENSPATPLAALEAWKKSPHHNGLILNLGVWRSSRFDALGVSIRGGWASIWFGSPAGGGVDLGREIKGLGVTYDKLVNGLTGILNIGKESSVGESDKWVGVSADKSLRMEIYGRESDISETSIGITARLNARSQLSPASRAAILTFLKNISPNWIGREKWFNDSFGKALKNARVPQRVNVENKTFELKIGADRGLSITVKPNRGVQPIEL
ncbi:MAG: hypothetical protein IPN69_12435 [Acidobacteria bacterium]|nr:hypothetical protein [Acidobacteriota bacterium]